MSGPHIDVLIPTHNRYEATLRAVDSVCDQTYRNLRILVVDDASTDDSASRLAQRLAGNELVEFVVLEENRSAPGLRQWALEHVIDAPWVALLDSDDTWMPTKLERQADIIEHDPAIDVVMCWHEWRRTPDEQVEPRRPSVPDDGRVNPLVSSNMSTPLIRRGALDAAGGFVVDGRPVPTCDNIDLYLRLSKAARFASVDELLVTCWHGSSNRVSAANPTPVGADELRHVVERERVYLEQFPDDLAALELRIARRYLAAGQLKLGRRHLRAGLSGLSTQRARLSTIAGLTPFIAKEHARVGVRRLRGQPD